MSNCEKMENLNEYIIRNLHMEIMDTEMDSIVSVKVEVKKWADAKQDISVINELKKYEDYSCLYVIDYESGGLFGQGYIIINNDMEYVGFVRTV